eukprot:CAMPEP_0168779792 /NCGR_PEP_ID=MMETSP0725-20121227/7787_1 /TAXON_ID=265536 /ORGANISM="Amphiprora sp., Strain CCMP467" /LENGTH=134 /DNA_ID=CAMNT_0008829617 /DNA_START=229 /DNA_END=637 /DNA_ORIENTATION=+
MDYRRVAASLFSCVVWIVSAYDAKTVLGPLDLKDGRAKIGVNWVLASSSSSSSSSSPPPPPRVGEPKKTNNNHEMIYMGCSFAIAKQEDELEATFFLLLDQPESEAPYMTRKMTKAIDEPIKEQDMGTTMAANY